MQAIGGPAAQLWAAWRTRVGEWYFRSFNPQNPQGYLSLAYTEFVAALNLDPAATDALTMIRHLAAGTNVLGLARTAWVPPDFTAYQQVITAFQPLVNDSVSNILSALHNAADIQVNLQMLVTQASELVNQRPALAADVTRAKAGEAAAQQRLNDATAQLDNDQTQVDNLKAELNQAQMQVQQGQAWQTIGTVFEVAIDVIAIAAGVVTDNPVAIAGGILGLIPIITQAATPSTVQVSPLTGALNVAIKSDTGVTTWVTADGWNAPTAADIAAIKAASGGLGEAVQDVASFLNVELAMEQAASAQYNNLAQQYSTLISQLIKDANDVYEAQHDLMAASLDVSAAEARQAANESNIQLLSNKALIEGTGISALTPAIRSLLGVARVYQDGIAQYLFMAARAVDEWTLSDISQSAPMNMGYVNPDQEEDAFFDLQYPLGPGADGDPTQVEAFADAASDAWATIPSLDYQSVYDTYNTDLQQATIYLHLTDPELLQGLQASGAGTFTIGPQDIEPDDVELKLSQLRLAIIGSTADDPTFSCLVTHMGDMTNVLGDGTQEQIYAPPSEPVIVAAQTQPFAADDQTGLVDVKQLFWGRSPLTTWKIAVEPSVVAASSVDLANVTEVTLMLIVECKLASSIAATPLSQQRQTRRNTKAGATNRWSPAPGQAEVAQLRRRASPTPRKAAGQPGTKPPTGS